MSRLLLPVPVIVLVQVVVVLLLVGSKPSRGEVLFRQKVMLDHSSWSEEGSHGGTVLESEYFTYHDWEIVGIEESVWHFCYIHSVKPDTCERLVEGVHRRVEHDFPHLLSRYSSSPGSHNLLYPRSRGVEVRNGQEGGHVEQEEKVEVEVRREFNLLDMKNTVAADMDWILELFPPSMQINILSSPISNMQSPLATTTAPAPDILLVNVASNRSLIREYLDTYPILILIHLSDEWYGKKHSHALLTEFYGRVPLVLREFSCHPYRSLAQPLSNVMQLLVQHYPGYLPKKTNQSTRILAATVRESLTITYAQRDLVWAFAGNPTKSNRPHVLSSFSQWGPHQVVRSLPQHMVLPLYRRALFVPCGNDNSGIGMDVSRIQEAILAGAIPVVIGSEQLMRLQFQFEGDRPPFVYAATPEEALLLCRQLFQVSSWHEDEERDAHAHTHTVIDELRRDVAEWYIRVYQNINNRVRYTLESFG